MRFGGVQVVACGVPAAFFNPVFATDPAASEDDLRAGIGWVEGRSVPATVNLREDLAPQLRPVAESLGFVADGWRPPAMVLDPIPNTVPAATLPGAVSIRAGRGELAEDWYTAYEATPAFRRLFGRRFMEDPAVRIAVGYLDAEPVAGAMAIGVGTTLGVYTVGTVERARRRGFARAATWAAIDAGRAAWGPTIAILQSREMGVELYRSMGFEEIGRYVLVARPAP